MVLMRSVSELCSTGDMKIDVEKRRRLRNCFDSLESREYRQIGGLYGELFVVARL